MTNGLYTHDATSEIIRVSLRGCDLSIKNNVLTIPEASGFWTLPILCGDSFKLRAEGGELSGRVSHVISGDDGRLKHICLLFDGSLRFEGDLSGAEFIIP